MASRNIFLPKELNRRIPNGTYGGVRGMNNLYSIGHRRWPIQQNGKNRNDTNASWAQTLASPLGEEGHEVAKGCWRVRIGKKLKVEQAAYRRSG